MVAPCAHRECSARLRSRGCDVSRSSLDAAHGVTHLTIVPTRERVSSHSVSLLIGLLLSGVSTRGASAQPHLASGSINAIVTDTGLVPIADADIAVERTAVRITTGDNGRFQISPIPAGRYVLTVQRLGFRSVLSVVDVSPGDTLRLAIVLEHAAPLLDAVVVTGTGRSLRMAQFDERRAKGNGQFLTEEEIAKRNSVFATELLRTFKGMTVKSYSGAGGQMQYFAISSRSGTNDEHALPVQRGGRTQTIRGCPMQVYVDGVAMPAPFSLDELPSPASLAGIEMYTGPATTPVEFGGADRSCGVILVWTKDRT
jgi:hypothetical protein